MTATVPEITDEEVRDWAKSTGREIGSRGRIPAGLRAEYEAIARAMQEPPPGDPLEAEPGGQAADEGRDTPKAARKESTPRATSRPRRRPGSRSRIRQWFAGDPPPSSSKSKTRGKARPERERKPLDRLFGKAWSGLADAFEHRNVPIARCMDWQSPYVGQMAEETIKGTFIDRIVQPIARGEEKVTTAAAVILMPLIVGALQLPGSQPEAGVMGVVRYQLLSKGLEECVETQLEAFGADTEAAERVRKSAEEREELHRKTQAVIGMIFATIPNPQTPDEAAAAARAEQDRRQAAADAARDYVHTPGATVVRGYVEPDNRGQAAEQAAARMAEAGQQAAAIANVNLGTARF